MQNHKWLPLRAAPLKIWMMRTEMFIWVILGVQEGSRHLNSQKGRYLAWKRQFFFFLCKLEEGLTSKKCVERGPSCVKRSIHQTWNPSLNSGQDTWLERQNTSCILDMACQSTWPTCRLFVCTWQYSSPISTLSEEHLIPEFPNNSTGDKHVPSNVLANPVKWNMAMDTKYTEPLARGWNHLEKRYWEKLFIQSLQA